ncbi:hypothetical protein [Roseibium sp.]|uniref:hypothetical protein n=1 Tax=Roseibium sp. TaxID=1936156 RepID=UPI003BA88C6E
MEDIFGLNLDFSDQDRGPSFEFQPDSLMSPEQVADVFERVSTELEHADNFELTNCLAPEADPAPGLSPGDKSWFQASPDSFDFAVPMSGGVGYEISSVADGPAGRLEILMPQLNALIDDLKDLAGEDAVRRFLETDIELYSYMRNYSVAQNLVSQLMTELASLVKTINQTLRT